MTRPRSMILPAAAAVAALAATAAPAVAGTTAPLAARTPAPVITTTDGIVISCQEPGGQDTVIDNNIHIRSNPNGSFAFPITKGALFDDAWKVHGTGPFLCITQRAFGGRHWALGWSNAHPSRVGWVGVAFLAFHKQITTPPGRPLP